MSTTGGPAPPPNLAHAILSQAHCLRISPFPQSPALQDETGTKRRHHAAAIVLSSSGADAKFEWLDDLSSKEDLKHFGKFSKIYVLLPVDKEYMAATDKIKDDTTRDLIELKLSKTKSVTLDINDLYMLDGFLGCSWKDIQKRLRKIKKKLKFILYVKKNEQNEELDKAIKDLHLDHVYLLGETDCDAAVDGCTVLKFGNFIR